MKCSKLLILLAFSFIYSGCQEEAKTKIDNFKVISSLTEGSSLNSQSITVQAEGAIHNSVTINYFLKEGTAKFNQDVNESSGELEFSPQQPEAIILLDIQGDAHLELNESFQLVIVYDELEYPFTVTIKDDDAMESILEDANGYYTPETYPSMKLAWSDEFNGNELNTANWTYEIGNGCNVGICGWGNNELESYTSSVDNSRVENGKLIITALNNNSQYTSARIKTQGKISPQFGRIDVRAKLPKGHGIWPAIWMLGENISNVGWPACGEIDIMELVGHQPAQVHGTAHFNNGGYQSSTGSTTLTEGDFSEKYHVFTVIWDRNQITWYVDNMSFKTFSSSGIATYPFNSSFFFIVNIAVGGNWPGPPDGSTVFPQEMTIDYIRVFQ